MSNRKLSHHWKSVKGQFSWKSLVLLLSPLFGPYLVFWTEDLLLSTSAFGSGAESRQDRAVPGRL